MHSIDTSRLIAGAATRAGTERYVATFGAGLPPAHYSDFLHLHFKLSSLGVGTFPGAASDEVDAACSDVVERAALAGINVFDTAAHYRYGRSARALGAGLARAFAQGVAREQVFVIGKGGFLLWEEGPPPDIEAWFESNIVAKGLGRREERVQAHLLTPQHIAWQIDRLRSLTGLATLDAFLIDQPEVAVPVLGKEAVQRRLEQCFAVCEQAVRAGRIGCYGVATFESLRVETDAPLFQSLPALLGLAERAARLVHRDDRARHSLRVVCLPFNLAMTEGFTRFGQATGQGNVASALQAAHQLRLFVVGSHALLKGHLATRDDPAVAAAAIGCANPAQRALQFNRSTPGLGVSFAGMSTPAHLEDLLAVARLAPLERSRYLALYERA